MLCCGGGGGGDGGNPARPIQSISRNICLPVCMWECIFSSSTSRSPKLLPKEYFYENTI